MWARHSLGSGHFTSFSQRNDVAHDSVKRTRRSVPFAHSLTGFGQAVGDLTAQVSEGLFNLAP